MELPRFVVLHHTGCDPPHYDFMLQGLDGQTSSAAELATFRAPRWPISAGDELEQISSHRADFLTYEGPLTGGRGAVRRVARGRFGVLQKSGEFLQLELKPDHASSGCRIALSRIKKGRNVWLVETACEAV